MSPDTKQALMDDAFTRGVVRPLKQATPAEQIESVFGDAVTQPVNVRVRCADCGFLEQTDQMWFVPKGKHRLFGDTRAVCKDCRDVRLDETK